MPVDPGLFAIILASAVLAALGATLLLMIPARGRRGPAPVLALDQDPSGITLLFDGTTLVDATPEGRALLAGPSLRGSAWDRLRAALEPRFPGLEGALLRLPAEGTILLAAERGAGPRRMALRLEFVGGLTRIRLTTPQSGPAPSVDTYCSLVDEAAELREMLMAAPLPIWREAEGGEVIWANPDYLRLASEKMRPEEEVGWPLPVLFPSDSTARHGRQRLDRPNGGVHWFDMAHRDMSGSRVCFAMPADAVQRAETGLRDFMQTLSRTFAHLPVGLAIFDGQRQLNLFNPAFLDLTGLPVDYLSARPRLAAVLDALRDRNMIPEPRDYRAWRKRLAELERTGIADTHDETWSLPGGQTYRVSARPHSDGGVALMIEDISTEMTRTRRYRADLELGQSVVDALGEGIAVFSASGQLVMSNDAYGALWGHDPSQRLAEADVATLSEHWKGMAPPTPVWHQIEEFVAARGERTDWETDVRLSDGRLIACRAAPLAGGATMVAFRTLVPGEAAGAISAEAVARRA
ncbi:PAS-domain containing protein [Neotabrizicola shimadae]|uniref:PAS-domain containing protein n=1 Tax=Neotabrizicola shimadae TaxID=2807096 RepID=A0A8G0ZVY3_9RHOB|nr:PAS-domain containing protein [Neotabrizicola shimadae]QYZ69876.1 PAS-domain containing protein [Neotabrizicola shimadae]